MVDVVTTWAGAEYSLGDYGFLQSTSWETEWPFGCTTATWSLLMPPNFSTVNASRIGADVRIYDGPVLTWGGYLSEVEVDGQVWTFHAKGYYALAEHFLALDGTNAPSSVPSTAVAQAIIRGWKVSATGLSSSPMSDTTETVEFNTVRALLDLYAESVGKRWKVDEAGRLALASDPTTPKWHLDNGDALRSVADDDYITAIYGRYVTAETSGKASDWGVVSSTTTAANNLRREEPLDLTGLGLILSGVAQTETANRLALAGVRKGFTSGIEIPFGDLTTEGGTPVRLGQVKAGEMLRAYTVADAAGIIQLGAAQDIILGRVSYTDGADTLSVTPIGLVPRQLSTILASPQKPPEPFEGTAA